MRAGAPPEAVRALFPEYEFLGCAGAGAYGAIWLARTGDGGLAAVKHVPGDGSPHAERERRALRKMRALSGEPDWPEPLVRLLAFREAGPGAGFAGVMPAADPELPGWSDPADYRPRTLAGELAARRALPVPECLELARRLLAALDFLHRHQLVHRDVKPANVIYVQGRPVLADMGLVTDTREAGSLVGTPGYVPQEQQGRPAADIYSLGVLLRAALTGRTPEEAGTTPLEEADVGHPLFPAFLALATRAAAADARRRPQSARAFLEALEGLAPACGGGAWRRRGWGAACAVAGWLLSRPGGEARPTAAVAEGAATAEAPVDLAKAMLDRECPAEEGWVEVPMETLEAMSRQAQEFQENGSFLVRRMEPPMCFRAEGAGEELLAIYDVTQSQYEEVSGGLPEALEGCFYPYDPIWGITEEDAEAFCARLNERVRAPAGWRFAFTGWQESRAMEARTTPRHPGAGLRPAMVRERGGGSAED